MDNKGNVDHLMHIEDDACISALKNVTRNSQAEEIVCLLLAEWEVLMWERKKRLIVGGTTKKENHLFWVMGLSFLRSIPRSYSLPQLRSFMRNYSWTFQLQETIDSQLDPLELFSRARNPC